MRCKKWRFLEGANDPAEVSEEWHCGLQSKYTDRDADDACSEPEQIDDDVNEAKFVYGQFGTGSIVLSKMAGML